MAFKQIDVETLPVTRMVAGNPNVTLTESGQAVFSSACEEFWGEVKYAQPLWDESKRLLAFKRVEDPKGKKLLGVRIPKNGKSRSISVAGLLKMVGYDYKAAGNQSYDVNIHEKQEIIALGLPAETPERRPVQKRTKKVKSEEASRTAVATEEEVDDLGIEV